MENPEPVLGFDPDPELEKEEGEVEEESSLLDSLSGKRKVIAETKEQDFVLPGYDREPPHLIARYRLVDGKELALIGQKLMRTEKDRYQRNILSSVDTLIAAVTGFYVDLGDGAKKPLTLRGKHLTKFNDELAEALKFHGDGSARSIVFGLFGDNDIAITKHFIEVSEWFGNTSAEVDRELYAGNL